MQDSNTLMGGLSEQQRKQLKQLRKQLENGKAITVRDQHGPLPRPAHKSVKSAAQQLLPQMPAREKAAEAIGRLLDHQFELSQPLQTADAPQLIRYLLGTEDDYPPFAIKSAVTEQESQMRICALPGAKWLQHRGLPSENDAQLLSVGQQLSVEDERLLLFSEKQQLAEWSLNEIEARLRQRMGAVLQAFLSPTETGFYCSKLFIGWELKPQLASTLLQKQQLAVLLRRRRSQGPLLSGNLLLVEGSLADFYQSSLSCQWVDGQLQLD